MFPAEKSSLLDDVAREFHGHPTTDNDGTLMKILNEKTMDIIMESTWTKFWENFLTFSTVSAGIVAIALILQTIKMITKVVINGFLLYRIYG